MSEPSNTDNIIDSRDVIDRIEYLESEIQSLQEYIAEAESEIEDLTENEEDNEERADKIEDLRSTIENYEEGIEDYQGELASLLNLQNEAEGYSPDWKYGATLIKDDYFEQYAEELAEDIGAIDRNASWPLNHIDWEEAAEDLKQDYTAVDYDGETYWIR